MAGGSAAATALAHHASKFPTQCLQLNDLCFDRCQMAAGNLVGLCAIEVGVVCKIE
jgi:hypothetical protein